MDDIDYQNAFNIAKEAIRTLGFYLTDQIALLYTINLKEFALDLEDVERYLQVYGQKMGLLYSTRSTDKEGKTCIKYTRWFSEQ